MPKTVNVDYVTKTVEIKVNDGETESLVADMAIAAAKNSKVNAENAANSVTQANAILAAIRNEYGYPFTAATAAAMTDTTKIYVYTGSETGYTNGNWYYYDGTAWTDGGVYNATAFETDPTLIISGAAADAKVTGDTIQKVFFDYNRRGFWETNGIGSGGTNYGRAGSIRSFFLKIDRLFCVKTTSSFTSGYLALYKDDYTFLVRYSLSGSTVYRTSDMLSNYPTAKLFRVEICSVDEDTSCCKYVELIQSEPVGEIEKNVQRIDDEINGRFCPLMENGSIQNPFNTDYISTGYIPCNAFNYVELHPNRPNEDGYYYKFAYQTFDREFKSVDSLTSFTETNYCVLITNKNVAYVRFIIAEVSDENASVLNPLRVETYGDNLPYCVVTDGTAIYDTLNICFKETDINEQSLWEIGGIGSSGTNNNSRHNGIRTVGYLSVDMLTKLFIAEGFSISVCLFNSNKSFLVRFTNIKGNATVPVPALLKKYNAKYFRIEIQKLNGQGEIDTTDFEDTSDYNKLQIMLYEDEGIAVVENLKENNHFSSDEYLDRIEQARYIYNGASGDTCLTLLHFSDVHDDLDGMKNALNVYNKYSTKIDAMLHTGDTVKANFSDGIAKWISSGCAEQVLNVIGNHDTELNLVLQAAGKDNVYNTIFAPYIDGWNVVQPEGVDDSTSDDYHALYYYKDFNASGVRLIVLDTNFWDNAEKSWLQDVLNESLLANMCVVLACHNVKKLTEMTESHFSSYPGDGINEGNTYANQPNDWLDPVQDFIDAGGNFACILAGHNHGGHMGTMTYYPDIFVYVSDKASVARTSGSARISGEINANTVNIVTINPIEKLFKIVKIGAEVNGKMQGRHVFCYDYANKRIISQW